MSEVLCTYCGVVKAEISFNIGRQLGSGSYTILAGDGHRDVCVTCYIPMSAAVNLMDLTFSPQAIKELMELWL